jgi:uncharacterized tellurite resistance protein B-like protein
MENLPDPHTWSLREWLAFLLLAAVEADGRREKSEMRYLRVELGNEAIDKMLTLLDSLTPPQQDAILQEALPIFLQQKGAREKIQRILRDIFLADGEYGPEEQAMTRKIGDWLRAAS